MYVAVQVYNMLGLLNKYEYTLYAIYTLENTMNE